MSVYDQFADYYVLGPYPHYSQGVASAFPGVLRRFDIQPQVVLDLCCGEGTFAVAMAEKGMQVTGADRSPRMLHYASQKVVRAGATVGLVRVDMRALPFESHFDLVTCWFDSLNYLLEEEDLERTFAGVARALKDGGWFIFDMNTIYGLAIRWFPGLCRVEHDEADLFIVHQPNYDFDRNVAEIKITGFKKEGEHWRRMDEIHHERGYSMDSIRAALEKAGLEVVKCYGSLIEMALYKPESGRVYVVARKDADGV